MAQPDYSDRFNTQLTPDEERAFQRWAAATGRLNDTIDYDLRGAWKADARAASNGHLPDTWKKPNHMTFSEESQYSTPENGIGGRWLQSPDGAWQFWASPANASPAELQSYFRQYEPAATLILPDMPGLRSLFPR